MGPVNDRREDEIGRINSQDMDQHVTDSRPQRTRMPDPWEEMEMNCGVQPFIFPDACDDDRPIPF